MTYDPDPQPAPPASWEQVTTVTEQPGLGPVLRHVLAGSIAVDAPRQPGRDVGLAVERPLQGLVLIRRPDRATTSRAAAELLLVGAAQPVG